jgi:protein arginine kinase activator
MICDNCKKNEAFIYFITIGNNGELQKINLCRECIKDYSFLDEVSFGSQENDSPFNVLAIDLGHLLDMDSLSNDQNQNELDLSVKEDKKCSNCGISISQVKKNGRLGCPKCYDEFRIELNPFIKIIQSGTEHKGKIPLNCNKRLKIEKKIKDLKFKLEEQIIIENFEEAAKLRDKITSLQKQLYLSGKKDKK